MRVGQPAERRLRTMLPRPVRPAQRSLSRPVLSQWRERLPMAETAGWWAAACALILGTALNGALTEARYGGLATVAYLCSLAVLLAAVPVTIAVGLKPVPVASLAGDSR
jgi:hypothetical protein